MRHTETSLGRHFGQDSESIVQNYNKMKRAREEARQNGLERKSNSVNNKSITSLVCISKYTNDLIDPKLEIPDGDTSVKYYALQDYVEKHKACKKRLYQDQRTFEYVQAEKKEKHKEETVKREMRMKTDQKNRITFLQRQMSHKFMRFGDNLDSV